MYDLGDVVPLTVSVVDANGDAADATTMTVTITLPDGTVDGPHTVTSSPVGDYAYDYVSTLNGLHDVVWTATGANAGSHRDCFVAGPYQPLVSIATLIDALGVGYVTADADRLRDTLASASAVVEARRPFRRQTKTHTASGGGSTIHLPWKPVVSITSIVESGATLDPSSYVLDPSDSAIWRGSTGGGVWRSGIANITVTAVVGYATPPRLAMEATIEQARHMWETRRGGGSRGGQFGNGEGEYLPGAAHLITYRVAELLDAAAPGDVLPGFA